MSIRPELPPDPFLVVGLGKSGIAAARALLSRGDEVIAYDASDVGEATRGELEAAGASIHVGTDGLELLDRAKTVIKSPGVPREIPLLDAAHARGIEIIGELELGWRLLPNHFTAVTGSNGKTTTVELLGHIYREASLPVVVAGNVGTALTSLVGQVSEKTAIICEVSSFQLEDCKTFAPDVAVLLNIGSDHLDRHGSVENYRAAKLRIFAHQNGDNFAVVPVDFVDQTDGQAEHVSFGEDEADLHLGSAAAGEAGGGGERPAGTELPIDQGVLIWRGKPLIDVADISLRGAHNLQNAMAAAAAALVCDVPVKAVRGGLKTFPGVRHRLEKVATIDGILYVNDSKATNVDSTLAALSAFDNRVHLILGGRGKDADFSPLAAAINGEQHRVYLIGEDADKIAAAFDGSEVVLTHSGDLASALSTARQNATDDDVILLSPACASYDQYSSFEHRGDHFRELVLAVRV